MQIVASRCPCQSFGAPCTLSQNCTATQKQNNNSYISFCGHGHQYQTILFLQNMALSQNCTATQKQNNTVSLKHGTIHTFISVLKNIFKCQNAKNIHILYALLSQQRVLHCALSPTSLLTSLQVGCHVVLCGRLQCTII